MPHLYEIAMRDLTEEELGWLDKAMRASYTGQTLRDVLEDGRAGSLVFWRFHADGARGIIATRLLERNFGRELWIEALGGSGLLGYAQAVREAVGELAARADAKRLGGAACRPGLARLYREVFGLRARAEIFVEELAK